MKKIIIFLLITVMTTALFGHNSVVTSNTALTLPKGRIDVGIVHPMVISISDAVDLVTHPLTDILVPKVGAKINWLERGGLYFSTQHSLSYATFLLSLISNPGTGGVLPADNTIPQVFTLDNWLLATYVSGVHVASLKIGAELGVRIPNDIFDTIDYPVLFTNTAAYHLPFVFTVEANYRFLLAERLTLLFDGGIHLMPEPIDAFEIRQTTEVLYSFSRIFSASAGYLLTYGNYPYGQDWKVFPFVDVVFSFGGK